MSDEQEERAETTTVVLYPRDKAYVVAFSKRTGRSFSNALRRIIQEHAEQNGAKEREAA